jgi:hypothetical protein
VRTLREGLDLTARMRVLVEAIRELTNTRPEAGAVQIFRFDGLLRDTADDLRPVGEAMERAPLAGKFYAALGQSRSALHSNAHPSPARVSFGFDSEGKRSAGCAYA